MCTIILEALMEGVDSSVTLMPVHQIMWCCIPDDQNVIFAVVVVSA